MNNANFTAAILDKNNIIINVLVFDDENTMKKFGAKHLTEGQGIGDVYMTPEEYKRNQLYNIFVESINRI